MNATEVVSRLSDVWEAVALALWTHSRVLATFFSTLAALVGGTVLLVYGVRVVAKQRNVSSSAKRSQAGAAASRDRLTRFAPAPHLWSELSGAHGTAAEFCAACHVALDAADEPIQSCVLCGATCHNMCCARVLHDCKHVALRPVAKSWASGLPVLNTLSRPSSTGDTRAEKERSASTSSNSLEGRGARGGGDAGTSDSSATVCVPVPWRQIPHHFVALPESSRDETAAETAKDENCIFCNQPCVLNFLAPELHSFCLWCSRKAHDDCLRNARKQTKRRNGKPLSPCTYGANRRVVIPPVCVELLEDAASSLLDSADAMGVVGKGAAGEGSEAPPSPRFVDRAMKSAKKLQGTIRRSVKRRLHRRTNSDELRALQRLDIESSVPPSKLYKILPLPSDARPVLVFVNARSGGQQGAALLKKFRRLLNPLQVWELPGEHGGPEEALRLFANVPNLRIAVCGGDGSVAWILSALDAVCKYSDDETREAPPVSVLPLGTGNDLGRAFNWAAKGLGIEGSPGSRVENFLRDTERASVALLDRWTVCVNPIVHNPAGLPRSASASFAEYTPNAQQPEHSHEEGDTTGKKGPIVLHNYMSIGVDAKVALTFHNTRERHPEWFKSQVGNKLIYGVAGAGDTFSHSMSELSKQLHVEVDGKVVRLPPLIEGIIVLNIDSYMGGVDLWGSSWKEGGGLRAGFHSQLLSDERIEVVGIYGTLHLAQLQTGLARAVSLAQGSSVRLTNVAALPMQVDGEPWLQPPATVSVAPKDQVFMLRRRGEVDGSMTAAFTDALADCKARGVITAEQERAILTEMAKRELYK
mmetsp:Transcript_15625/g.51302  ORF Transcript_15625/g.51302 Transcript_15625/m.51302 type:complete len:813 (-) Transcript_15625:31-2469(-)